MTEKVAEYYPTAATVMEKAAQLQRLKKRMARSIRFKPRIEWAMNPMQVY
jgi:hypothetical protein